MTPDPNDAKKATWLAPVDEGNYTLSCKIDDGAPLVSNPEKGTRDDSALTRSVIVKVIKPKIVLVGSRNGKDDVTSVCGGGWDATHGYAYYKVETGVWTARLAKPDPHIITYTATVTDSANNPLVGKTVKFTWNMPVVRPDETSDSTIAETRTATTDAAGKATVDVVSGNKLTKDTDDETGAVLFDEPVEIKATCLKSEMTQNLNVLATQIKWQYKNEAGTYVDWDGSIWGLYSDERKAIPLRAELTYDDLLVAGHSMSWAIDKIFDKADGEVLPSDSDYVTYGQLSGTNSTTTASGGATATFTLGYNFGQVILHIDDENVNTLDIASASSPPTPTAAISSISASAAQPLTTSAAQATAGAKKKKKKRKKKPTLAHDYYKWVANSAGYRYQYGYPAPSGTEDNELMPETRDLVVSTLLQTTTDFRTNPREPYIERAAGLRNPAYDRDALGDPGLHQWWFAQVIGDDGASGKYHFADMKLTKNNKIYLYGAAFDIVLTNVPIFAASGKSDAFRTYVFDLRHAGIVAWHRWVGEPGSAENEIHCIDPAVPFIKTPLGNATYKSNDQDKDGQILAFINGETGGSRYLIDWEITTHQKAAVKYRATTKQSEMKQKAAYLYAAAVDWPNKQ